MNSVERKIGPITVQRGKNQTTYYVVGNLLYSEWGSGKFREKSCWSLSGLSPHLGEVIARRSGTDKLLRISALILASAVVVFFSDYNSTIPLLAPLLFGVGALWFVHAARKIYPRSWTIVRNLAGEEVVSMMQPKDKAEDWLKFEKDLSEAIVAENKNEA